MDDVDEIKQRVDILDIVSQYVSLVKAGRLFKGLCPFHAERHPSFIIDPERQTWHCFGCGQGGDVLSFIMKREGVGFHEALDLITQDRVISPDRCPRRSREIRVVPATIQDKKRLYQVNKVAARYFHDLLLRSLVAGQYVASRGFSANTVAKFQLGYSLDSWDSLKQHLMEKGYTESELLAAGLLCQTALGKTFDRFRNRLIFPIADMRRRIIGFGARVLDGSLPKYINSPQTVIFDKGNNLYGLNLAAIKQQNQVVIVEGYIDAITAHQHGFTNVVATMGTSMTERQLKKVKKLTRNITLVFDADTGGQEAMLRYIFDDTDVKAVILPDGYDPDEVIIEDAKTWQSLLDNAIGASAVERLIPIIAMIKDKERQARYLTRLSSLSGLGEKWLNTLLTNYEEGKKM